MSIKKAKAMGNLLFDQQDKKSKSKAKREAKEQKRLAEKQKEQDRVQSLNDNHLDQFASILNEMFFREVDTKYVIHCGPTNSGKTYQAIKALKEKESGAYLAPLRLLAWEVFDRLNSEGYPCDLITGEEQVVNPDGSSRYVSSTIEMLDYSKEYDLIVIDESFMIGDSERGKSWLKALLDSKAKEIHVIVNQEAVELIKNILSLTKRKFEVREYQMLNPLKFSDTPKSFSNSLKGGVYVTFSRTNVLINKMKLQQLGLNVGVLYGNLPPEVKKKQIQGFLDGTFDVIVSTDVIGMGINLPAKFVVFLDVEKFDGIQMRALNSQEVRQIAGRAGRYGLSDENSFVSADAQSKLKFIKQCYEGFWQVKKAFVGFDYQMFSSFPAAMSIRNRISAFLEIKFIPENLRPFVSKENVQRYFTFAALIDKKGFDLPVKWVFLTAPIKENNKLYFENCVNEYAKNGIIKAPTVFQNDYSPDIKYLEDTISEIELYLNLTRHLNHDSVEKENTKGIKDYFIQQLQEKLLDKKLALTKKCKLCSTQLSITYPYGYCNICYEGKVKRQYDDDDYWN